MIAEWFYMSVVRYLGMFVVVCLLGCHAEPKDKVIGRQLIADFSKYEASLEPMAHALHAARELSEAQNEQLQAMQISSVDLLENDGVMFVVYADAGESTRYAYVWAPSDSKLHREIDASECFPDDNKIHGFECWVRLKPTWYIVAFLDDSIPYQIPPDL